jgi:hypothetical protein
LGKLHHPSLPRPRATLKTRMRPTRCASSEPSTGRNSPPRRSFSPPGATTTSFLRSRRLTATSRWPSSGSVKVRVPTLPPCRCQRTAESTTDLLCLSSFLLDSIWSLLACLACVCYGSPSGHRSRSAMGLRQDEEDQEGNAGLQYSLGYYFVCWSRWFCSKGSWWLRCVNSLLCSNDFDDGVTKESEGL